ncbi:LOG family protein [Streptomyces kaempferi]|uniref:LOG family protein n=1 Tax=Streptomyces kaempferi TaxID=333725 RepID=A0ABW3XFZ3_9ACTN
MFKLRVANPPTCSCRESSNNTHVTTTVYAPTMGERLHAYLDDAGLVVAMGGGVGTLHELTAALYYATTIRSLPVRLLGPAACCLSTFLRAEGWLTESPTRPLGFLRELPDAEALAADLKTLAAGRARSDHHACRPVRGEVRRRCLPDRPLPAAGRRHPRQVLRPLPVGR